MVCEGKPAQWKFLAAQQKKRVTRKEKQSLMRLLRAQAVQETSQTTT